MSSRPLLRVKLPLVDKLTSIEDSLNYVVKELNAAVITTEDVIATVTPFNSITSITELGVSFVQSYSSGTLAFDQNFTFTHNIGSTPSGFLILYNLPTMASTFGDYYSFQLVSFTSTQITVKLTGFTNNVATGSFRILVMR